MATPGLLDALLQGVITGSIIAAGALGLSLIYSIAEVPNFAHGDMITVGAYLVLLFNAPEAIPFLPDFGSVPLVVAAVLGIAVAGGFGAVYELAIFRRFRERDADLITMVIVSLGLSLILRNVVLFLVGSKNVRYETARVVNTNVDLYLTGGRLTVRLTQRQADNLATLGEWGYPLWLLGGFVVAGAAAAAGAYRFHRRETAYETVYLVPPWVLGVATFAVTAVGLAALVRFAPGDVEASAWSTRIGLSVKYVVVVALTLLAMFLLNLVLKRTKLGKAMRATADNMGLAEVRGVDVDRVQLVVWVIAGLLTALAGVLTTWFASNLNPNTGFELLLPVFAAVILGGIRSPYGAVLGSFIIGVSMECGVFLLPPEYAIYRTAIAFVILVVVLMVRPEGIRGDV
jgi:neutral amino acid transport system permease protein